MQTDWKPESVPPHSDTEFISAVEPVAQTDSVLFEDDRKTIPKYPKSSLVLV